MDNNLVDIEGKDIPLKFDGQKRLRECFGTKENKNFAKANLLISFERG